MYAALIKYGLMTLAVIGILFGVFSYGHSKGYSSGHDDAWNAQQKTIQAMVDKDNLQTSLQNAKITQLEQDAAVAAGKLFAANAKAALTRTTVIQTYATANPQIANSCGWDIPTANAINDIISADPNNDQAAAPIGASQ